MRISVPLDAELSATALLRAGRVELFWLALLSVLFVYFEIFQLGGPINSVPTMRAREFPHLGAQANDYGRLLAAKTPQLGAQELPRAPPDLKFGPTNIES